MIGIGPIEPGSCPRPTVGTTWPTVRGTRRHTIVGFGEPPAGKPIVQAGPDRDRPWLRGGSLGEADLQDTLIGLGLCLVEVNLVGKRELAMKRPESPFPDLEQGFGQVAGLLDAAQRQNVASYGQVDRRWIDARYLGDDDHLVGRLVNVDAGVHSVGSSVGRRRFRPPNGPGWRYPSRNRFNSFCNS